MPATVVSRASKSVLDLTDGGNLTAYLTANQPTTQVFNSNTETYSPDWSTSNLVITPLVYIDQSPVSMTSSKLTITWKRKEGNGSETNLTTGESVTQSGSSKYTLTVSANKLAAISSGILTYVAHIDYKIYEDATDHTKDKTVSVVGNITFSLVKSGDSRVIYIVGDQVFRISSDGQTVTPSEILLTAITQNVTVGTWQYWDASGNTPQWRLYPGSQSGDTTLTVDPSHNVFNDGIASIRVVAASPHTNLYDVMTVYKIQDGLVGQNAQTAFLTNENITFAGNKDGKVAESAKFCNVVAYDGTTKTMPTVGTPTGVPSGNEMKVVKGSTTAPGSPSSGDVWYDIGANPPALKKYNGSSWTMVATSAAIPSNEIGIAIYIAANSTLGGSGEQGGTIGVPITSPVSTTLQIRWSKVNTGATGDPGTPGAHGLNVATVYLYQRANSAPSVPSGNCTYNFTTGVLTGSTIGQWSQTIPNSNDPCYITMATASSTSDTDTIGTGEWSTPVLLVKNGTNGADGAPGTNGTDGYNQAVVYLYRRSSSAPSAPASGQTYTFATGALSSVPTGWSTSIPASDGNPCYVTTAAAISRTATATISGWASPTKLVEDGEKGDDGDPGQDAYLLTICAPNGTVFTHSGGINITSIELNAYFYKGSTDITSTSYFRWYKYNGSGWTSVQSEKTGSNNGNKYTASASDVATSTIYRCRARETNSSTTYYYDYITLIDKTDNYQSVVASTAGDVFQNGVGDSELYCRVWQNGTEVDPLKATTFSKTVPTAPASGNPFYYHVIDPSTATEGSSAPASPTLNQLWLDTSSTPSVLKRYNGSSWVTVTNAHETLLMRWSGSAWVDVTNNSTYKHTLTYIWYRLDIDGEPMDEGNEFAEGKVIHVNSDDVDGKTTFVCQTLNSSTLISQSQFSIRDDSDITVGNTAPVNPMQSQLWLDTSVSPNLLKKYNGATWDVVNDTSGIYSDMSTQIGNAKTEIMGDVETMISEVELTNEKFTVFFNNTVGPGINSSIGGVQSNLESYQTSVSTYMRFDSSGVLELGQTGNNFKTQITNTKLSFLEGSSEIAYISNQSMYITTARVTDTLSIGTNNGYGYFDWTVTPTGLGLKWRGEPAFDPNHAYQMGDLCNYENHIYECLINMTVPDGEWIAAHWQQRI